MRKAAHPPGCARCGAGAGGSAIEYQSLEIPARASRAGPTSMPDESVCFADLVESGGFEVSDLEFRFVI